MGGGEKKHCFLSPTNPKTVKHLLCVFNCAGHRALTQSYRRKAEADKQIGDHDPGRQVPWRMPWMWGTSVWEDLLSMAILFLSLPPSPSSASSSSFLSLPFLLKPPEYLLFTRHCLRCYGDLALDACDPSLTGSWAMVCEIRSLSFLIS